MQLLFVFLIVVFAVILFFSTRSESNYSKYLQPVPSKTQPIISGWIAWWAESSALALTSKHSGQIHTVSPVWFMVDEKLELKEVGKVNKLESVNILKVANIKIYPTLGSELSGQQLSFLLNDEKKVELLIDRLVAQAIELGVDGIDTNLEGIKKDDKDKYTDFLAKLALKLHAKNLKLSATVHAQTEIVLWEGAEGHDLSGIGKIADEVRVMTYDEHSSDTQPGPISSFKWLEKVTKYTLTKIPKEKIVFGIPSYGYLWGKDDSKGLQYDEFTTALKGKTYTQTRDKKSGEIIIKGDNFSGWLSDSNAMVSKMNMLRNLGFNNFVIWHLGGMDETFFDKI